MDPTLEFLAKQIKNAKKPEDIFGALKGTEQEKEEALKKIYRDLCKNVHPDKFSTSDLESQCAANECTARLNDFYREAKSNFSSYGNSTAEVKEEMQEFGVGDFLYRISPKNISGDFSEVYFGERIKAGNIEKICLKVAKDPDQNELLKNESQILKSISHKSIPTFLEYFIFEDKRVTNVIKNIEDSYDLHTIRQYFTKGLPQEHTVWVMDRLLSVLGYLHSNTIIHGSIEPGNILIRPKDHNSFLIDYSLAISEANSDDAKYSGLNDFSAPEINKSSRPHPSTDMYSLGKSMIYLLGGDGIDIPNSVDVRIQNYLNGFVKKNPSRRKNDAWAEWHSLQKLRTEIFGAPHQFLNLDIH